MRPDPLILGLAGHAGAGKDTAAAYLHEVYGFHRFAFADPLREMLFALLDAAGADHVYVTERHLKEQPIPELHSEEGGAISYRRLAQTLGTEWARTQFGQGFWLRVASRALGLTGWPSAHHPVHELIVISDVRFANEAAWIKTLGGAVVRLHRHHSLSTHASETQVQGLEAWAEVDNTGSPEALSRRLDELMARLGIPPKPAEAPIKVAAWYPIPVDTSETLQ